MDEKITTDFEPTDVTNKINKAYLDKKLYKVEGHISYIKKDYNEYKMLNNKQSVEEVLIQKTVKTTLQILYDKSLFGNYDKAKTVFKDFLYVERRRGDLGEVNEGIQ